MRKKEGIGNRQQQHKAQNTTVATAFFFVCSSEQEQATQHTTTPHTPHKNHNNKHTHTKSEKCACCLTFFWWLSCLLLPAALLLPSLCFITDQLLFHRLLDHFLIMASFKTLQNFVNGKFCDSLSGNFLDVISPATGDKIAAVPLSNAADLDEAVKNAKIAFEGWSGITIKQRAAIMFRFHSLVEKHSQELAELIVQENGKNITEGKIIYDCIYLARKSRLIHLCSIIFVIKLSQMLPRAMRLPNGQLVCHNLPLVEFWKFRRESRVRNLGNPLV
jgi:hypothetical protein